eukprot:SAG31_NODE_2664_length_5277_cov_461.678943_7_plen_75_part_01
MLLTAITVAQAAITKDQVTNLPGLRAPLPAKLYSGYLEPSLGHFLHYIFMESWSDPKVRRNRRLRSLQNRTCVVQ